MGLLQKIFGNYSEKELKRIYPIQQKVLDLESKYAAMSEEELKGTTQRLKDRLEGLETLDDILPDAFAACREASWRVLGMKHFPVQILGGIILHQGRIAEMRTGEGKTLVATLPAYLNALAGKGVHIVTVNDYLARRDSEWMGKVYRYMGLTCGLIVNGLNSNERREAYAADITYGTNNEMGFDYLRDNMVIYKTDKVQRGHSFAIVDEVDSILIDEARTPLIISGQGDKSSDLYDRANNLARWMKATRVKELDSKSDNEDIKGDYIVDEKARTVTLTAEGVRKAEEYFGIENLNDVENMTIAHHVNQAIRAWGIMKKDIDYIVRDNQVYIIDEFTGRIMYGRRFNQGLHQAIEAKEGVKVAHESRTLATITFQNYFRLYEKLSGMTGTAMTEETEFKEIYALDIIAVPTNKPMIRIDHPDSIFKTERGKFAAVLRQIKACHEKGQPILVGTISIEKSEVLSRILKANGVKHNVLNAKHHEKEAEIIAQAGKFGAVTIATNMAGRGTDIMLGGNAEYLAKSEMRRQGFEEEMISAATSYFETDDEAVLSARSTYAGLLDRFKSEIAPEAERVREAGGLFILGTERHDSRRIDNQLRGRAGRQGDCGESWFFVSAEDDLMRLFGGDRIYAILDTMGIEEDQPIDSKMLSNSLESAQGKVESRNFAARKNVLEFDDVMNQQREIIYAQRNKVLDGEEIRSSIEKMINDVIESAVSLSCPPSQIAEEWNFASLRESFGGWLCSDGDFRYDSRQLDQLEAEDIVKELKERAVKLYDAKEEEIGSELMREVERVVLLRSVDTHWMDHIDAMDELRRGIYLRAYGQHDPVIEFKNEGYDMFNGMTEAIKEETAKRILTVSVRRKEDTEREQVAKVTSTGSGDGTDKKGTTRTVKNKIGPNDPCPCGSGKKYKKCCGMKD
ncbi:MAG: preprotein translocase subunit SecA [Clostridia bacterium]|nr:preprotein translocase subunit SecA [Clostridia bacterium]